MNIFNTASVKENKNRPAWVTPEILIAKRKSCFWAGASLLCAGAAAVAAKVILSSLAVSEAAVLLPVIRNTVLLLILAFSLIISVLYKRTAPAVTGIFMTADGIAAGILASGFLYTAPTRWFGLAVGLGVLLPICLLYLAYQSKYEPEETDPQQLNRSFSWSCLPN